jgi:lipoate---protein ligase
LIERWVRLGPVDVTAAQALERAQAMLAAVGGGSPPLLAWSRALAPALVLGRAAGRAPADEEACRQAGVELLRRASGGGPVLWDAGLLALDVALPRGHRLVLDDVVATYAFLGDAIARGLSALGAPARVVSVSEARAAGPEAAALAARACFGGLSPFEVIVAERKVVGLAQVRRSAGALLQAGIALRLDAGRLAGLLDLPTGERALLAAALAARAGRLEAALPGVAADAVIAAVERALADGNGIEIVGGRLP